MLSTVRPKKSQLLVVCSFKLLLLNTVMTWFISIVTSRLVLTKMVTIKSILKPVFMIGN